MRRVRGKDAAVLAVRLDQMCRDMAQLRDDLADHQQVHARDRQLAVTARRWAITTFIGGVTVAVPLIVTSADLLSHSH